MYRPKGCENPMPCSECKRTSAGNNCATSCHPYIRYQSKEAAYDAMLEGLIKEETSLEQAELAVWRGNGYLVFIPEEGI